MWVSLSRSLQHHGPFSSQAAGHPGQQHRLDRANSLAPRASFSESKFGALRPTVGQETVKCHRWVLEGDLGAAGSWCQHR